MEGEGGMVEGEGGMVEGERGMVEGEGGMVEGEGEGIGGRVADLGMGREREEGKNGMGGRENEMAREGGRETATCDQILLLQGVGTENAPWRITKCNQDFSLCETYAPILGVPLAVSDDDLRAVAQFRSKGRIPVS